MMQHAAGLLRNDGALNALLDRLPDPLSIEPFEGGWNRVAYAVMNNPGAQDATKARAQEMYEQGTRGTDDQGRIAMRSADGTVEFRFLRDPDAPAAAEVEPAEPPASAVEPEPVASEVASAQAPAIPPQDDAIAPFDSYEAKVALLQTSPALKNAQGSLNARGQRLSNSSWEDMSAQDRAFVLQLARDRQTASERYNEKVRAQEREANARRLAGEREIRQANGEPFKTEKSVAEFIAKNGIEASHTPAQVGGGWIARGFTPSELLERENAARGIEPYMVIQDRVIDEMGLNEAYEAETLTDEQWDRIEARIQEVMRQQRTEGTVKKEVATEAAPIKAGDRVNVTGGKHKGKSGVVQKVNKTYLIRFDDGSEALVGPEAVEPAMRPVAQEPIRALLSDDEQAELGRRAAALQPRIEALTPEQARQALAAIGELNGRSSTDPHARLEAQHPDDIEQALAAVESADAGPETGPFGPIFTGLENQPEAAIERLMQEKRGEVPGAFTHPELGPIAFVYGDEKMGLRHIAQKRGMEWVNRVPEILRNGRVERDPKLPRVFIVQESDPANVAVIRLDWFGDQKTWLITAYPDSKGEWSGADKTIGTAGDAQGSVQGNPSRSNPLEGNPTTPSKTKPEAKPESTEITDFGEKIGRARKDMAVKGEPKPKKAKESKDERPAWARRYNIGQAVKSSNPAHEGRWFITDTRSKDRWTGKPKTVGERGGYATQAEAEADLAVIDFSRNHIFRTTADGKHSIWRRINERRVVRVVAESFDSRVAAARYAIENARAIVETSTTFGEADVPKPPSTVRIGEARREGTLAMGGGRGWHPQPEGEQGLPCIVRRELERLEDATGNARSLRAPDGYDCEQGGRVRRGHGERGQVCCPCA